MLNFNDGISIDNSGELKILKLHDRNYMVGEGMLLPMDSYEECQEFIEKQKNLFNKKIYNSRITRMSFGNTLISIK